jgi:hypothetical protein
MPPAKKVGREAIAAIVPMQKSGIAGKSGQGLRTLKRARPATMIATKPSATPHRTETPLVSSANRAPIGSRRE